MKLSYKYVVAALCVLLAVAAMQPAAYAQTLDPTALQAALEAVANNPSRPVKAGVSASVILGSQSWDGATGLMRMGVPDSGVITTDTRFKWYSCSKTVTSAITLQLMSEGRLTLDDKLGDYLTFTNPNIDHDVTIRQLLTHGTGFPDFTSDPDVADTILKVSLGSNPDQAWDLYALMNDPDFVGPQLFAIGTDRDYSSTNYILLGLIIEDILAPKKFHEVLQERILTPVGLNNCYFPPYIPVSGSIAHPHDNLHAEAPAFFPDSVVYVFIPIAPISTIAWSTGGIVGTPKQLAKWAHSLYFNRTVLAPAAYDSLMGSLPWGGTPAGWTDAIWDYPGYGIFFSELNSEATLRTVTAVDHGGASVGYRSLMAHDTTSNITIAMSTNNGTWGLYPAYKALMNAIQAVTALPDVLPEGSAVQLHNAYPNPAQAGSTTLRFTIGATATDVLLEVYDLGGSLIATPAKGVHQPGQHQYELNTAGMSAGVYYYRMTTAAGAQVGKLVVQ